MQSCHRVPVCLMTGESAHSQQMLLTAAIADGTAVANWASSNDASTRLCHSCFDVTRCKLVSVLAS